MKTNIITFKEFNMVMLVPECSEEHKRIDNIKEIDTIAVKIYKTDYYVDYNNVYKNTLVIKTKNITL